MALYTVSITLSSEAECEADALQDVLERIEAKDFDHDSIEVEKEC